MRNGKYIIHRGVTDSKMWYWSLVAGNGKTIADGSEGYKTKSNAMRAAENAQYISENAEIHVEDK